MGKQTIDLEALRKQAIEERNAAINDNACNDIVTSGYFMYVKKYFSTTSDALEFLNTHHIDPTDVISLIKHSGEANSAFEYELIFFDRIKTEKYLVVDEKWTNGNPRLFKESEEVFSNKSVFMADAKFKSLLQFPPKHNDGYKHVYVLQQELEWMSGNAMITNISRSDDQPEKCVISNEKGEKIVL